MYDPYDNYKFDYEAQIDIEELNKAKQQQNDKASNATSLKQASPSENSSGQQENEHETVYQESTFKKLKEKKTSSKHLSGADLDSASAAN